MKISKDNIDRIVHNLDRLERAARDNQVEDILTYTSGALHTLGFSEKYTVDKIDTTVSLSALRIFWHNNRRPYAMWLNYQDRGRDWYINAEVRKYRGKINTSIRQLTHLLLDLMQAMGKVYDK